MSSIPKSLTKREANGQQHLTFAEEKIRKKFDLEKLQLSTNLELKHFLKEIPVCPRSLELLKPLCRF